MKKSEEVNDIAKKIEKEAAEHYQKIEGEADKAVEGFKKKPWTALGLIAGAVAIAGVVASRFF